MQRMLNTLYVTTEGAWLKKDGETVVIEVEKQEKFRLPLHMLEGIVCYGRAMISSPLMGYCCEKGITISFFNPNGRFQARVEGPVSGNVLLRREQYRVSDDPVRCAAIVRSILAGKIHNQRAVVHRALRDHGDSLADAGKSELEIAMKRLNQVIGRLMHEETTDVLRGREGEAGQVYFGVFPHFLRVSGEDFRFDTRNRRPPKDRINALLSFLYTLLTHDCRSALEGVGLDPAVGFLHRDRPGRPSLALDLAEEFRAPIADRLALSLINRRQLNENDFVVQETGAVILKDDARKTLLVAYQERKRETLKHPFLGEDCPLGLLPHLQAQLLARHLRGDLDGYPPFLWK